MAKTSIGNATVGDGYPTYIVAEIGINHNGDLELAKREFYLNKAKEKIHEMVTILANVTNNVCFSTVPGTDRLFYPALLNCSKFDPPDGRPLSWICTQKLNFKSISSEPDDNTRMRTALRALLHALLETGYNLSSEHHEASSWFTESVSVDPRIATIERWVEETEKDPLFVLDVPWLKTGLTLERVIDRVFDILLASRPQFKSAGDIQRILFNNNRLDLLHIPF